MNSARRLVTSLFLGSALALAACEARDENKERSEGSRARAFALAPHAGSEAIDAKIRESQNKLRRDGSAARAEQLAWLFVQKARLSYDPGYYKLAEACADLVDAIEPGAPSSLLIRGHVKQSLHAFDEAERIARKLVAARGAFFDHGLLGDVLLDRGDLDGAFASYQAMLDLKPCLQSYVRAGHARWLRGDARSARTLFELAVQAGSRRAPEALAWAWTRLAKLHAQEGRADAARSAAQRALEVWPDCASAKLTLARLELARGDASAALPHLAEAAASNPLPEFLWAYADALRAAGDETRASATEVQLEKSGAADDPRTYALYLATRRKSPRRALELAKREAQQRADVYTHDALALAHLVNDELDAAQSAIDKALAEGTRDARIYLHAALIARAHGTDDAQNSWLARARALQHDLLPSERKQL